MKCFYWSWSCAKIWHELNCCHFNSFICDTDTLIFFIWKNINLKFFLFSKYLCIFKWFISNFISCFRSVLKNLLKKFLCFIKCIDCWCHKLINFSLKFHDFFLFRHFYYVLNSQIIYFLFCFQCKNQWKILIII
jgi:hypothetical protein